MSRPKSELGRCINEAQHLGKINWPFCLSTSKVTPAQYKQITDKNSSQLGGPSNHVDKKI